jgi:hypothetical protein
LPEKAKSTPIDMPKLNRIIFTAIAIVAGYSDGVALAGGLAETGSRHEEVSRLLGKSAAKISENLDGPPCAESRLTTTYRPKTNSIWPTNVWFSG